MSQPAPRGEEIAHATSVAIGRAGILIIGPSGSGKSSLALALMSLGARLVADDRTILHLMDGLLWASAPVAIAGRIEARGIGILAVETSPPVVVRLVIDMGEIETARLPPPRRHLVQGISLPCLHKCNGPHFHAAIWHYMKTGPIA